MIQTILLIGESVSKQHAILNLISPFDAREVGRTMRRAVEIKSICHFPSTSNVRILIAIIETNSISSST